MDLDPSMSVISQKAMTRLCISLLLRRRKHDKIFLKRDLVDVPHDDEKVTNLTMFLYKWIENFSESIANAVTAAEIERDNHSPDLYEKLNPKPQSANKLGRTIVRLHRPYKTPIRRESANSLTGEYGFNSATIVGSRLNYHYTFKGEIEPHETSLSQNLANKSNQAGRGVDGSLRVETGKVLDQGSESPNLRLTDRDTDEGFLPTIGKSSKGSLHSNPIKQEPKTPILNMARANDKAAIIEDSMQKIKQNSERSLAKRLNSCPEEDSFSGYSKSYFDTKKYKAKLAPINEAVNTKVDGIWSKIEKLEREEQDALLSKLIELYDKREPEGL
jgi:hypothetical protein